MLRSALLAARNALSHEARNTASRNIGIHVLTWVQRCDIKTLAVYSPIRGEPDLTATWSALAAAGIKLALPMVVAADTPLQFVEWTPGQPMMRDAFGVNIPVSPHRLVTPTTILIPCLGFTLERIRLGYGGGFYDRTLAALSSANTVGIAFDCGRVSFDAQAHDIALRAIITESGVC